MKYQVRYKDQVYNKSEPASHFKPACFGNLAFLNSYRAIGNDNALYIENINILFKEKEIESNQNRFYFLTDYLSNLKHLVRSDIVRIREAEFQLNDIQWVFGVPLGWDNSIKRVLRLACFDAGLIECIEDSKLILCPQQEACLLNYQFYSPSGIKPGEISAMVDLGTDTTVFCASRLFKGLKLKPCVNEYVVPYGTASIDNVITNNFKSQYGEHIYTNCLKLVPNFTATMKSKIEHLKTSDSFPNELIRILNVEGHPKTVKFLDSELGHMAMQNYFTTISSELKLFISKIKAASPGTIIKLMPIGDLVLTIKFEKFIKTEFQNSDIEVIVCDPRWAVASGCSILGSNQFQIQSRVHRYSYGTQFSKLFDPKVDDPQAYRWGTPPNQYIASFLPFTTAGKPIPPDHVFEQLVCPANDEQSEFPFGLYYSHDQGPSMKNCQELTTIIVSVPEEYKRLGRRNRFRILMTFGITDIKFAVIHIQSGLRHECSVFF